MLVGTIQADIFSGQIRKYTAKADAAREGSLLPEEEVKAFLREFLNDSDYEFELEYIGINRNVYFEPSGPVLYTIQVVPTASGYRFHNSFLFYLDAKTKNIWRLAREDFGDSIRLPLPVPAFAAVVSPEQALLAMEPSRAEGFIYLETLVFHSLLSGEYELMHTYGRDEKGRPGLFINARTGKEEAPAYCDIFWNHIMEEYGPSMMP